MGVRTKEGRVVVVMENTHSTPAGSVSGETDVADNPDIVPSRGHSERRRGTSGPDGIRIEQRRSTPGEKTVRRGAGSDSLVGIQF